MTNPSAPPADDALISLDRPHDSLFRFAFERTEHAASVLRTLLPAYVAQRIDWTTLKLESASFVDETLAPSHSDLLFSVLIDGSRAFLYLLFEHQSTPDRTMNVRLVRYQTDIWRRWYAEGHGPDEPLPPILPILLAQGERPWPYPTRLTDTHELDPLVRSALGCHLLDVDVLVIDLAKISLEALDRLTSFTEFACLVLVALKVARTSDDLARDLIPFARRFRNLARDRKHGGRRDIGTIFRYIFAVSPSPTEPLQQALRQHAGKEAEEVFVTSAQQLLAQGHQEGRLEGRAEGRLEGRAETLAHLLERKFGPLDATTRERIRAATADELDAYLDRILPADTLAAVFAPER